MAVYSLLFLSSFSSCFMYYLITYLLLSFFLLLHLSPSHHSFFSLLPLLLCSSVIFSFFFFFLPKRDMGDLKTMQEATMMTTLFNVLATEWVTGPKGEMIEDDQTEKDKVIKWRKKMWGRDGDGANINNRLGVNVQYRREKYVLRRSRARKEASL